MNQNAQQTVLFDEFEFDAVHRRLLRRGEPLSLYAKTFDLLAFLVDHNGNVVTKDEILESVWPGQIVEESNLSVQIAALRKALGEKKKSPRFVITVPGKGYKFVADLQNRHDVIIEKHKFSHLVVEEEISDVETYPGIRNAAANAALKPLYSVFLLSSALALSLLVASGLVYQYYNSGDQKTPPEIPFSGARIKQLTTKEKVYYAAISPDGNFYAYTLFERGEYKNSLWLGQTDGTGDLQLRPSEDGEVIRGLAFSPDGKTLYFALTRGEDRKTGLYRMPVIGGVAEKLSDGVGSWFTLSPDGKQIAFFRPSREQDAVAALVIAGLDGTNARELVTRPRDKTFSSFSPAWSHDGSLIAFGAVKDPAKQSDEIYVVRTADGHIDQLGEQEWLEIINLTWRRDGLGVIISATDKSEPKLRHLWHIEYPTGTAHRLSQDTDSYAFGLSTSSDGGDLLAVQLHRESNIWIAPSDDLAGARQVTFSAINGFFGWHGFDWTTNGDIVFSAGVDTGLALKTMRPDGTGIRQITSSGYFDQRPSVSRDGRFIFFRSNRNGATDIWRVNSDGSDLKQVTAEGSDSAPHVTPDGKWLIYISSRDGKNFLSRISVEGGDRFDITDQVTSADPRVSPDGNLIACVYKKDSKSPARLAVVPIEGGRPIKLFDVPSTANFAQSLRWTPDGKAICYRDWANGIWRQDLRGGAPKRLEGLPEEKFYNFVWSPDGRHFAFTRGREIRDAVLISDSK